MWLCVWETFCFCHWSRLFGAQAVQGPRVLLCVVLGVLGSRLPNLGVLGKAEYLSLEFTHPGTSALPLQRVNGSILLWATTRVVSRATTKVRSFVCRCLCRLPLPLSWPLKFSAPPPSLPFFCAAAVARSAPSLLCQRRRRRPICAAAPLSAPPPSSVLRRRLSAPPPPDFPVSSPLLCFFFFTASAALPSCCCPVVTPIRLTKDNYLSWSAALEIRITSRGRLPYITGDKPAPSKTDPQWANWALEDSQVKVWIISSVSADIQPLILRKPTSFEMWNVLARMYGHKKRVLRTYQIKRSIYALKQGDLSVASYYAALKTKWEELDYHVEDNWDCGSDHARHWEREWMDRTFLFLGGLRDEFESIRSQILNCDEIPRIEDVYARVESEEQRRQVMQIDPSRVVPRPSLAARPCLASALLGDALIVISLDTLLIFVGIFIPRRGLFVDALLLVGVALLCRNQIKVDRQVAINRGSLRIKSRNYKLILVVFLLLQRTHLLQMELS
ncbi:hypothetical protein EJ110_NYTH53898 [Nymphaea thermarum]|nr:hypothetical protein EJ110_NYTH53898 [Nymphaea thermarum]